MSVYKKSTSRGGASEWGGPPLTSTRNTQHPVTLLVGGSVLALLALAGVSLWWQAASAGYPMMTFIFPVFVVVGVTLPMSWWCFRLAFRRAKRMREYSLSLTPIISDVEVITGVRHYYPEQDRHE